MGVEFCFVMQNLKIVALNSALQLFILLLCSLLGQEGPSFGDVPAFINDTLPFCRLLLLLSLASQLCCYSADARGTPAAREAQVFVWGSAGFCVGMQTWSLLPASSETCYVT